MFIFILKYVCCFIALVSTLLFISDMIASIVNVRDEKTAHEAATFRIKLIIIMSLTWPIIFLL